MRIEAGTLRAQEPRCHPYVPALALRLALEAVIWISRRVGGRVTLYLDKVGRTESSCQLPSSSRQLSSPFPSTKPLLRLLELAQNRTFQLDTDGAIASPQTLLSFECRSFVRPPDLSDCDIADHCIVSRFLSKSIALGRLRIVIFEKRWRGRCLILRIVFHTACTLSIMPRLQCRFSPFC